MPRILLFGGSGKLGGALHRALGGLGTVTAPASAEADAYLPDVIARVLDAERPQIVVNAAAMLGIDACEREPERALRLNAIFPRQLARWCADHDAILVHISSDAVFADSTGPAYDESAAPAAPNLYGATKAMGDGLVAADCPRHYLCRCPLIFGPGGRGGQFTEGMLARLRACEHGLRVATDIVCCPSFNRDLAERICALLASGAAFGLYHLANTGQASLHDLVVAMRDRLGLTVPVAMACAADFPGLGRKNLRTPITSRRLPPLRPWREALHAWLEEEYR